MGGQKKGQVGGPALCHQPFQAELSRGRTGAAVRLLVAAILSGPTAGRFVAAAAPDRAVAYALAPALPQKNENDAPTATH